MRITSCTLGELCFRRIQEHNLFERYSARAHRVVFITRRQAGQSGAAALDPGHVIEAIVLEDQGKVADGLGVSPDSLGRSATSSPRPSVQFFTPETASGILVRLQQILPHGKAIPDSVDMPISSDLSRTFEAAMALMTELHHKQVEPLHLLAAALSEESSQVSEVLRDFGISREGVIQAIKRECS